MSDGYAVVRKSTIAYLLEVARENGGLDDVPDEVARDLGTVVADIAAPIDEDRLAAVGPILSVRQHVELISSDSELEIPRTKQGSEFWQLVVQITHSVLRNEAEAIRRVIAEKSDAGR